MIRGYIYNHVVMLLKETIQVVTNCVRDPDIENSLVF